MYRRYRAWREPKHPSVGARPVMMGEYWMRGSAMHAVDTCICDFDRADSDVTLWKWYVTKHDPFTGLQTGSIPLDQW